jgi:sec-independent protein translocase protein TatA
LCYRLTATFIKEIEMNPGPIQLIIVLVIVLLLFGRNKIPQLMGDVAKGIKSFKRGMKDEEKNEDIEKKSDEDK